MAVGLLPEEDECTTPKGKQFQIPAISDTPPPPEIKPARRVREWGSATPKGNDYQIPAISDAPRPPGRKLAKPRIKWVSHKNNDSPATPPHMNWFFCKTNYSRPLNTLPFFTGMAPRYFRWNGEDIPIPLPWNLYSDSEYGLFSSSTEPSLIGAAHCTLGYCEK